MKNTFRLFFVIDFVLALILAACAPQAAGSTSQEYDKLDEILARGTLTIATDPNYPPFSLLDDSLRRLSDTKCTPAQYTANQFSGFDAATGIEIAERMGVEPCFVTPQWSQLVAGDWSNAWDVSVGSMTATYERMEVLYFTQPYFATPIQAFVHKDNTTYQVPEDLSGKRVGICAGCTYENYLNGTLKMPGDIVFRIKDAEIVAYDNEVPAVENLSEGDGVKLDALITQISTGQDAIKNGKPLRMIEQPLYFAYASVAIDKKNSRDPQRLVMRVTEIIQQMHADGTLSTLALQWLGTDLSTEAAKFDFESLNQFP